MCYMRAKRADVSPRRPRPAQVGVRELRQNLSVYLERILAGEHLEVTDRGQPVAMLVPLPPRGTLVERLVAEGRAIPAAHRFDEAPPGAGRVPAGFGARVQRALQDMRKDDA